MTENKMHNQPLNWQVLVATLLVLLALSLAPVASASPIIGPDSEPQPADEGSEEEISEAGQPAGARQAVASRATASQGANKIVIPDGYACLLYTSPSPRDPE